MMLKADLHIHAAEDKADKVNVTAKEIIDKAVKLNFNVLSFTFHNQVFYKEIKDYAEKKGILLIPGIEKTIEGKHILLYNFKKDAVLNIRHFEDLRKQKGEKQLVIAAHPFFPSKDCIGKKIKKYSELFDAIEFCFMHNKIINFNRKAIRTAKKLNKPVIANSDTHFIEQLGENYTLINAEKNIDSIINAIKQGKIERKTRHLSIIESLKLVMKFKMKRAS